METLIKKRILVDTFTSVFLKSVLIADKVVGITVEEDSVKFIADGFPGEIKKQEGSGIIYFEVIYKDSTIIICSAVEYETIRPFYINDYSEYMDRYEILKYIKRHKSENIKDYFMDLLEKMMEHYRQIMDDTEVFEKMNKALNMSPCIVRLPECDKLVHKIGDKLTITTYYMN